MNSINNYNPQFKGLSLSKYNKEARIAASEFIANVTHQEAKDVIELTKQQDRKESDFSNNLQINTIKTTITVHRLNVKVLH